MKTLTLGLGLTQTLPQLEEQDLETSSCLMGHLIQVCIDMSHACMSTCCYIRIYGARIYVGHVCSHNALDMLVCAHT